MCKVSCPNNVLHGKVATFYTESGKCNEGFGNLYPNITWPEIAKLL